MIKKVENVHEAILALKAAVALAEYVRDLEKTDTLEINDIIEVKIDGKEYVVRIYRMD